MKILFYINTLEHGGAERVMANLANEMVKRGHNVIFVTSYSAENEYGLDPEINRQHLDGDGDTNGFFKRNLLRIKRLRLIYKSERIDLVISFMAEPNFRSIIAAMFLKVKTIISVRNDPYREYWNMPRRLMAKSLYLFATGCVFQTEDAMKFFSKTIQEKGRVILNPVSEVFYTSNNEGVRRDIVTVGRLEPQKNHSILIKAFSKIASDFPNEKLLIYGKGSLKVELENLISELKMQGRVFLMGEQVEIHEKIKNAKLFVLSSDYEGMPNVLMEAMALGIPAISTDCPCGGPKYLFKKEDCGVLVKVGDCLELGETMRMLLSNPNKLKLLSLNARQRANDFIPEKIYDEWESFIHSL